MTSLEIPESFVCPVTMELIRDPVVDRDGNSYEREAILQWLSTNNHSPLTRKPLYASDLVPNRALKDSITSFVDKNFGGKFPSSEQQQQLIKNSSSNKNKNKGTQPQQSQNDNGDDDDSNSNSNNNNNAAVGPAVPTSSPDLTVGVYQHPTKNGELIINFTPPAMPAGGSKNRFPVDIVCCVDVSGSMGSDAPVQDTKGVKESTGLNVLQVVGHAVRTVAALLGEGDRLAIVTYSTDARQQLPLTNMNEDGKNRVARIVNALDAHGRTNMWDGIQKSLEVFTTANSNNTDNNRDKRLQTILLLTDGAPTQHPVRGYSQTLSSVMKRTFPSSRPVTMSTFGFGYELDSKLMDELAELMCGTFQFIPDAGLLGVCFVNAVATILSTAATSVMLSVPAADGDEDCGDDGIHKTYFGDVQFGGGRSVWCENPNTAAKMVTVSFTSPRMGRQVMEVPVEPASALPQAVVEKVQARRIFLEALRSAGKCPATNREEIKKQVTAARDMLNNSSSTGGQQNNKNMVKAMVEDLDSQVLLALGSDEYFQRWGQHYALSLARANELCIQSNFKDKSVQNYGGKLFEELRGVGEAEFLKIPAPTPTEEQEVLAGTRDASTLGGPKRQMYERFKAMTNSVSPTSTGFTHAPARPARAPAPVSMSSYYDYSGGCVLSTCEVLMADGVSTKLARDVRRGDALFGGAVVQCAVRIDKRGATLPLVVFEDENKNGGGGSPLVITKFHPVRRANNNSWSFPVDVAGGEVRNISTGADGLFTFLLHDNNNKSFVRVNGIDVIAWGHGISDDATARHDFFGSRSAVVAALRKIDQRGFDEDGAVTIGGFERDPQTRLIRGLAPV